MAFKTRIQPEIFSAWGENNHYNTTMLVTYANCLTLWLDCIYLKYKKPNPNKHHQLLDLDKPVIQSQTVSLLSFLSMKQAPIYIWKSYSTTSRCFLVMKAHLKIFQVREWRQSNAAAEWYIDEERYTKSLIEATRSWKWSQQIVCFLSLSSWGLEVL